MIPQVEVLPTAVVANGDTPPELEIRFDMPYGPDFADMKAPLPPNWQLRFIHNQLFKHFSNPSRFCPGAFHSTIVRKAEFRSESVSVLGVFLLIIDMNYFLNLLLLTSVLPRYCQLIS